MFNFIKKGCEYMFKKSLCLMLVASMLLFGAGCGKQRQSNTNEYKDDIQLERIGSDVVAENGSYQLIWDDDCACAMLYDISTGNVYSTTPYDYYSAYDLDGDIASYMYNPITITYYDDESNNLHELSGYSDVVTTGNFGSEKLKNGVAVIYNFADAGISFEVDYTLNDDGISITVPTDKICEGDNMLVEISLAPYFASALNDSDSYIVVPTGSGAVIPVEKLSKGEGYSETIYGEDYAEPVTMEKYTLDQSYLPIFGIKNNDVGILGIFESGAESGRVNAYVGDTDIGYSNVYPSFRIRGKEEIIYTTTGNNDIVTTRYSNTITCEENLTVRYILLKDDPTYTGMANTYKSYLMENGLSNKGYNQVNLSVDILGSTRVKESFIGIPYTRNETATTFEQAGKIVTDLYNQVNGNNMLVTLTGFENGGTGNLTVGGGFKVSSITGGKKGLNALKELINGKNITLSLNYELISYQKSGSGFSAFSDSAFRASKLKIKYYKYNQTTKIENDDDTGWFVLRRDKLKSAGDKAILSAINYDLDNISFGSLSQKAYSDYRTDDYSAKAKMGDDVTYIMEKATKNGLNVVSKSANLYAALASKYLTECPLYTSAYNSLGYSIPLYEMVFRGYKPMTGESINLASDTKDAYLKTIAYGCGLQFTLCNSVPQSSRYDETTAYISSQYSLWAEDIAVMIGETEDYFNAIADSTIENYTLADGVSCTEFSNGTVVYVNFNDTPADTPIGSVEANSFIFE